MKRQEFFSELKVLFELDEDSINEDTSINMDSLRILVVIAFADENFNKKVNPEELKKVSNIKDLINAIGVDNFQ